MSEGATGFLVLMAISVFTALPVHCIIRHDVMASLCVAVLASIGFQFAVYQHLGYLDSFFIIALVTGSAVAFVMAAIVGVPFMIVRRKRKNKHVD